MTNYKIMNKNEKKEAINHKYEYELKQKIFSNWRYRDITGTQQALKNMKMNFELLKKHNPKSEYINKLENFIKSKEGEK